MRDLKKDLPRVLLPRGGDALLKSDDDWAIGVCGFNILVPCGTKMDGASIPRALWRVCGHPLEYPRVYAALAHDFLYGGVGAYYGVTRKEADEVYRELLVRLGFGRIRAAVEFYALRAFGWMAWKSGGVPDEIRSFGDDDPHWVYRILPD